MPKSMVFNPNLNLEVMNEKAKLKIPTALLKKLSQKKITTIQDLKKIELKGLSAQEKTKLKSLQVHAELNAFTDDISAHKILIKKGLTSPLSIARLSAEEFLHVTKLKKDTAFHIHKLAKAKVDLVDNLGLGFVKPNGNFLTPKNDLDLSEFFPTVCECRDCESALSPQAYLFDLVQYTLKHVKKQRQEIDLSVLENTFFQPFGLLPTSCGKSEEQVSQPRLCIEVLRTKKGRQRNISEREQKNLLQIYQKLLSELGTSHDEIRTIRMKSDDEQKELLNRLALQGGRGENVLEKLLIEDKDISEEKLESLFGFQATRLENGNLPDFSRDSKEPQIQIWKKNYLRQFWENQDATRSQVFLDPDLCLRMYLKEGAFRKTFEIWEKRQNALEKRLDQLIRSENFSNLNREKFERRISIELNFANHGLSQRLNQNPSVVKITFSQLKELAVQSDQGQDISQNLAEFRLSQTAFDRLFAIRHLLENNVKLREDEWHEVCAILLALEKAQLREAWVHEEKTNHIQLGPDQFFLSEDAFEFVPPKWRVAWQDFQDWKGILKARLEQEEALVYSLKIMLKNAEEKTLNILRDTLIAESDVPGTSLEKKRKWITENLLISANSGSCFQTTRISQAIQTLQNLLWGIKTGQLQQTHPGLSFDPENFHEEWKWLGSYSTWRAATFVYLYPENILAPHLNPNPSKAFQEFLKNVRSRFSQTQALAVTQKYAEYFNDITHIKILETQFVTVDDDSALYEKNKDKIFVVAQSSLSGKIYTCFLNANTTSFVPEWTQWQEFPLNSIKEWAGTVYQKDYLLCFFKVQKKSQFLLLATYFDLKKGVWSSGEGEEVELPDDISRYSVCVEQPDGHHPRSKAKLWLTNFNGEIYCKTMNVNYYLPTDANSFDSVWQMFRLGGGAAQNQIAKIHVAFKDLIVAQNQAEQLVYRILHPGRDDGFWYSVGSSQLKFISAIKQGQDYRIYYEENGTSRSTLLGLHDARERYEKLSNWNEFENWLVAVLGSSLAVSQALVTEASGHDSEDFQNALSPDSEDFLQVQLANTLGLFLRTNQPGSLTGWQPRFHNNKSFASIYFHVLQREPVWIKKRAHHSEISTASSVGEKADLSYVGPASNINFNSRAEALDHLIYQSTNIGIQTNSKPLGGIFKAKAFEELRKRISFKQPIRIAPYSENIWAITDSDSEPDLTERQSNLNKLFQIKICGQ